MTTALQVRTVFDEELSIDHICDAIASGTTLARWCSQRGLMFGEVRRWISAENSRASKYSEALELRRENLVQQLCTLIGDMVGFDPSDVFTDSGMVKPMQDWPPSARVALHSVDANPGMGITKVRFTDRLKAIEMLGKTLSMFAEKEDKKSRDTLADMILRARHGNKSSEG